MATRKLSGLNRRTLRKIDRYPSPREISEAIKFNQWPYSTNDEIVKAFLTKRDRALVAILYLCALRRSEANKLRRNQFRIEDKLIIIEGIKLSKAERHSKKTGKTIMRKELYRTEAWIPLEGLRAELGQYVLDYLRELQPDQELFSFSKNSSRIWQIVERYTKGLAGRNRGITPHWLRAYGENWLYDNWDKDLMAVANYVSVDPGTLSQYIRKGHLKYKGKV